MVDGLSDLFKTMNVPQQNIKMENLLGVGKKFVKLIGLNEVTIPRKFCRGKMRQPTFFTPDKIFRDGLAFGKNREFSWKISVSDRFFRLTLVKIFFHTKCGKTASAELLLGAQVVRSDERSDT